MKTAIFWVAAAAPALVSSLQLHARLSDDANLSSVALLEEKSPQALLQMDRLRHLAPRARLVRELGRRINQGSGADGLPEGAKSSENNAWPNQVGRTSADAVLQSRLARRTAAAASPQLGGQSRLLEPSSAAAHKPVFARRLISSPQKHQFPPFQGSGAGLRRTGAIRLSSTSAKASASEEAQPEQKEATPPLTKERREALQKEVVDAVAHNTKVLRLERQKRPSSLFRQEVERSVRRALKYMCPGNTEDGTIILTNVRDITTGDLAFHSVAMKVGPALGVGGAGLVLLLEVLSDNAASALGAKQLAAKITYFPVPNPSPSPAELRHANHMIEDITASEINSVRRLVLAAAQNLTEGARVSTKDVAQENGWAMPLFEAYVGSSRRRPQHHGGHMIGAKVILSQLMLGDGHSLGLPSGKGEPYLAPSLEARELFCKELILSVARMHELGHCHMDIKPENVLISPSGKPRLSDFGMVGRSGENRACYNGTIMFMDPFTASCAIREGRLPLSTTYDAWALGATAYVFLTGGQMPYKINPGENLLKQLASMDITNQGARAKLTSLVKGDTLEDPTVKLLELGVSSKMAHAVGSMLHRDKNKRSSVTGVAKAFQD
ncbi:hypothetical protein, conserved [Eimeria tenella]|uniref:mitogen-activated protein kinase kinase n=1 Tax=Eimeria tenella TaxID=5802 RepID=U6KPB8_EIMTE|nr:hypothetical protein, conserved [Eimeria tenella]CDJ37298.1 hypothetical protein, conserved [Eimeria tenella]|eukprot:XP_013228136.1 hypothetical protein, conserved [Eimeria tenella]